MKNTGSITTYEDYQQMRFWLAKYCCDNKIKYKNKMKGTMSEWFYLDKKINKQSLLEMNYLKDYKIVWRYNGFNAIPV